MPGLFTLRLGMAVGAARAENGGQAIVKICRAIDALSDKVRVPAGSDVTVRCVDDGNDAAVVIAPESIGAAILHLLVSLGAVDLSPSEDEAAAIMRAAVAESEAMDDEEPEPRHEWSVSDEEGDARFCFWCGEEQTRVPGPCPETDRSDAARAEREAELMRETEGRE